MRVLVIDDEEDVAELCWTTLWLDGHEVSVVTTGTAAVAAVRAEHPEIVLLDGMLPGIDGLEVLAQLRADGELSSIPVVMISARVGVNDRIDALGAGALAYLTKPFDLEELARVVAEVGELDAAGRADFGRRSMAEARRMVPPGPERPATSPVPTPPPAGQDRDQSTPASTSALAAVPNVLDLAFDAIVSVDESQNIVAFNRGAETTFGYLAEEVLGKPLDLLIPDRLVSVHRDHVRGYGSSGGEGRRMGEQRNVLGRRRDGSEFPAEASITRLELNGRWVLTAILRDATERLAIESELRTRARQQAAVAELGQMAIAADADAVMREAVQMVHDVLRADLAKVLLLDPDGGLYVQAAAGWPADVLGARVPSGPESQAGYTLRAGSPTVIEDVGNDPRFAPTALLVGQGVVSGLAVPLIGRAGPRGTMAVHCRARRDFTTDDVNFLQAVGNVVASALERSLDQRRLLIFLDAAPDATLAVDAAGRIVMANSQAEKMLGYRRDELQRMGVDALVPNANREGHVQHREHYAVDPRTRPMGAGMVLSARCRDGSEVPVEIMLKPVETDEGPLVFAALRDATERRRNDEVRDAFLHAVSHELRTPLTAVIGYSGLLLTKFDESMPEGSLDMVRRIEANGRKLERLLGDLLDLDRLARGAMEAQRQQIGIAGVIARSLESIDRGDRVVTLDAPADLEASIDPAQVERIVENLVLNALRHSEASTPVEVRVERSASGIMLVVEDRGRGVSDELKARIFEPFQRGTSTAPGTGIGLSLVARFAELHGGRAWVEDRDGGGSSFRVVLRDG